ncbi:MAG: TolC family protein [Bacteroidia bacterium]
MKNKHPIKAVRLEFIPQIILLFFCFYFPYNLKSQNTGQMNLQKLLYQNGDEKSSDTVTMSLKEAESLLIKNNLMLIAQQYNIDLARAQVLQAKLWDNPTLYMETNPKNSVSGQWFKYYDASNPSGSEVLWSLNQVIKTAGKRSNLVKLNKINATIAEDIYYDIMRSLKFSLRSDYFMMLQFQQGLQLLETELNSMNRLVENVKIQVEKGMLPKKDLLRLQALSFDIQNNIRDFITQRSNAESEFKTIIGLPARVYVVAVKEEARLEVAQVPVMDTLAQSVLDNRPDLKAAYAQVDAAKMNLKLQRSYGYPDFALTFNYTRYSNFIPNYYGVGLGLPLPLLNRNQGNIKTAKFAIQSQQATYDNMVRDALNDLNASLKQLNKYQDIYKNFNKPFEKEYSEYFSGLTKNYEQRNIGLIEFIDFFEDYRNTKLAIYNLEQDYMQAKEQVNFSVGKEIIK